MTLPAYDESFSGEGPLGVPGDMVEPEPWLPSTDPQTARLVEEAVQAPAWSRSVTTPADDPALRLLCLVSLLAEAEACTYVPHRTDRPRPSALGACPAPGGRDGPVEQVAALLGAEEGAQDGGA